MIHCCDVSGPSGFLDKCGYLIEALFNIRLQTQRNKPLIELDTEILVALWN